MVVRDVDGRTGREDPGTKTTYAATTGSIVHVEFGSTDVEATGAFLEAAFGWTVERDEAYDYVTWRAADPPFGGVVDRDGAPFEMPATLLYLAVDDVDAATAAVRDAGGEVLLDSMAIPDVGALTAFREPGGVVEAVWEDRGGMTGGGGPRFTDEPGPGSVVHVEHYAEDPGATRAFHEAVFDWTYEDVEGDGYVLARPPTPPAGGLLPATDDVPVGALLYLLVEDAAAAVGTVEDAGGTVLREPFDVEGWGTMAVVEAPGDVVLATWEAAGAPEEPPADSEPATTA